MTSKKMTTGLGAGRLPANPMEAAFARAWLGSPVGQCFLRDISHD